MNEEEAFQAALDANPEDSNLRLVFADWLEEQGDARAAGYREMGRLELYFKSSGPEPFPFWVWVWYPRPNIDAWQEHKTIPDQEWFDEIEGGYNWTDKNEFWEEVIKTKDFRNRRAAEDAVARAYSRVQARRNGERSVSL